MTVEDYSAFGMSVFEELAKEATCMRVTPENVSDSVEHMSHIHFAVVKQFGSSFSLNKVFGVELARFFEAIADIPMSVSKKLINSRLDELKTPDDVIFLDFIILYPSSIHFLTTDGIDIAYSHSTPSFRAFILHGDKEKMVKVDYPLHDLTDGDPSIYDMLSDVSVVVAKAIAKKWWKGHSLKKKEKNALIKEIYYGIMLHEGYSPYKHDIISKLSKEVSESFDRLSTL